MEVESDGACAEGCELDEFIYDDDELMESAVASPQSKVCRIYEKLVPGLAL